MTARGCLMSLAAAMSLAALASGCPIDDRTLAAASAGGEDAGTVDGSSGSSALGDADAGPDASDDATRTADSDAPDADAGSDADASGDSGPSDPCPDLDTNAVSDCLETLVQNPSFDARSVAGWTPDTTTLQSWQASDADSRVNSGSLAVENSNQQPISGLSMSGTGQCLAVAGGASYGFFAHLYIAGNQDVSGSGGFNVSFFGSSDCTGAALAGSTSTLPSTPDTWLIAQAEASAPADARSMSFRLVSVKSFEAPPFSVLFDDVLVKQK